MKYNYAYLLLSSQKALLGKVSPSLRAVIVDVDEKKEYLTLYFYFNGEISDTLFEDAKCVIREIRASFPTQYTCEEKILRVDFPEEVPYTSGRYAYSRKE